MCGRSHFTSDNLRFSYIKSVQNSHRSQKLTKIGPMLAGVASICRLFCQQLNNSNTHNFFPSAHSTHTHTHPLGHTGRPRRPITDWFCPGKFVAGQLGQAFPSALVWLRRDNNNIQRVSNSEPERSYSQHIFPLHEIRKCAALGCSLPCRCRAKASRRLHRRPKRMPPMSRPVTPRTQLLKYHALNATSNFSFNCCPKNPPSTLCSQARAR